MINYDKLLIGLFVQESSKLAAPNQLHEQGKFSGMHDFRWEPILEASVDGGNSWRQLRWRYKLNQGAHETLGSKRKGGEWWSGK